MRVAHNTGVKRQRETWLQSRPFAVEYAHSGSRIGNPCPLGILDRIHGSGRSHSLTACPSRLESTMSRKIIASNACWAVLLVCASLSQADAQAHPKPLGVYAHVDIEYAVQGCKPQPCSQDQQLSYLSGLYTDLLGNLAISGLAVGIHWDMIQLSSPRCGILSHLCPWHRR